MRDLITAFRRDTGANAAILFACALPALLAATGAALDYGRASRVRTKLLAAADTATIAAIAKTSSAMTTASTMSSNGPIPAGVTDALTFFNAQIAGQSGFTVGTLGAAVAKSGSAVTAKVNFTATVPTTFMGAFGFKSITVGGSSTAANNLPVFLDFYLLLDNTPSMGVGATPADVSKMVANTSDQCAFACHDLSDSNSYYKLAKTLGVTMRIDVLRTATQQLMDTATSIATVPNQFRMAIYTFGTAAESPGLTTIASLSSNLSTAKTKANAIDLMTVPYQNYKNDQDTGFDDVLTAMNASITTPGSGVSSTSPQKMLFFVSDGVADSYNPTGCSQPTTGGRCQEPIDTSYCKTIKDRGIKIAVLYTTYLPLPTNAWYNSWIKPFTSQISTAMQTCASPGYYFEVSPTEGISQAMNALFQKAVAEARLTN